MKIRLLQILAWTLLVVGGAISVYIIVSADLDGIDVFGPGKIDFGVTGQFGDFIGGVVGTIISAAGFIFLYLTFKEQRDSVAKERFESKYFELVKLHRDNVSELKYSKYSGIKLDKDVSEGRKVFRVIFQEFLDCLQEVRRFSNSKNPDDYIKPKYKKVLEKIIQPVNPQINLYELATIDIAFCIVFYGLGNEGATVLRRIFLQKYVDPYFYKLINYMQLKPTKNHSFEQRKWEKLRTETTDERANIVEELYQKKDSDLMESYSQKANYYKPTLPYTKYYGGHQHRLGHYFRHLFQSYKFLNSQVILSKDEKYFYGKILRAQLSTYEQALLFIDSISSLGFKWEFTPEYVENSKLSPADNENKRNDQRLITFYNLIKNLPGDKYLDIIYKDYYPKVDYESDEVNLTKIS